MNKRYLNGVLIVFLIAIWGSVIYKYFVKKTVVLQESKIYGDINYNVDHTITKDTFTLSLNDRDPFKASRKRTSQAKQQKQQQSKASGKTKNSKPIKSLVWPRIEYYGFVKSAQNETKMALIKVNGKIHRKREKETVDELRIVKAYSDSIVVSFNKENKIIKRK